MLVEQARGERVLDARRATARRSALSASDVQVTAGLDREIDQTAQLARGEVNGQPLGHGVQVEHDGPPSVIVDRARSITTSR